MKPSRSVIIMLMLTGVLASAASLIIPAFSRVFTDDILSGGAENLLAPLICAMILTALFTMIAGRSGLQAGAE